MSLSDNLLAKYAELHPPSKPKERITEELPNKSATESAENLKRTFDELSKILGGVHQYYWENPKKTKQDTWSPDGAKKFPVKKYMENPDFFSEDYTDPI